MGKQIMYLVSQTSGEWEDRYERNLLLTSSLEEAKEFKNDVDKDSRLDLITEPMTYEKFEELNEGYPDNWDEYAFYAEHEYDEILEEPAVDREGYTAQEFIEMREKVDYLKYESIYPCDIYEIEVGEPGSFKKINV